MSYNVTTPGLPEYIEQNKSELLHAAIAGFSTLQYIDIITGVKHKQSINFYDVSAPFQAGGTCATNASGDVVFSQTVLAVEDLKVENYFCAKALEEKYTQKYLKPGVKQEAMPLEVEITNKINERISSQMEVAVWQGNKTSHTFNTNLKQFDGLITKVDAASPVYATAQSSVTTGNIFAILQDMYLKIPQTILGKDLVYIMGKDTFQKLVVALGNANLFHVKIDQSLGNWEMMHPFFNIKVIGVDGLNNITGTTAAHKDRIFLTYADNFVFVTDLANDDENYDLWYEKKEKAFWYSVEWKAGTAVKFGTEIVSYKNS
jgi:hypothetical protein